MLCTIISGWGIIWKVLLSRLGLFKELFSGSAGKNATKDQSKEKRRAEMRHLKSSLSTRHRTKDGGNKSTKTVTFDSASTEQSESPTNEESIEWS